MLCVFKYFIKLYWDVTEKKNDYQDYIILWTVNAVYSVSDIYTASLSACPFSNIHITSFYSKGTSYNRTSIAPI